LQTLKNKRAERGLTLSDLSRRSGVSISAIRQIENGENSPSLRTLEKLARGLSCSVSELVTEDRTVTIG